MTHTSFTTERTDLDIAIGCHSDLHKDVFGVRPRGLDWTGATLVEVCAAIRQIEEMLIREEDDLRAEKSHEAAWAASEARWARFTS